ncbi:MAG: NAD(P)H-hydrate dehydratase [Chlamydiota bacterium]
MKIVTTKEMQRIEGLAYDEGADPEEFMDNAGWGIAHFILQYIRHHELPKKLVVLCGSGNNSGDAYVAGTILRKKKFDVTAWQLFPIERCSGLCQKNQGLFIDSGGEVIKINKASEIDVDPNILIVDGLLGTGFHGATEGLLYDVIEKVNLLPNPVCAIDIPSGLNGNTGKVVSNAIKADSTVFLGLPKLGFFLQDGWNYIGTCHHLDFGLPEKYVDAANYKLTMFSDEEAGEFLPPVKRNRHKYQAGYVVGLGGSPGMPGAAILASLAALRGGAGIVRLLHPHKMEGEISALAPEVVRQAYSYHDSEAVVAAFNKAKAAFIGPGIGVDSKVAKLFKILLPQITVPCIIDADGLNLLAGDNNIDLPSQAILTPHWGEMCRLLGVEELHGLDLEILEQCQEYARQKKAVIVLKGAPTCILQPDKPITVIHHGTPGMATAGAGDVLAGLIAALCAQGIAPAQAACLGVYLHACAGEFAAEAKTPYCMIASDIIDFLPDAFKVLMG